MVEIIETVEIVETAENVETVETVETARRSRVPEWECGCGGHFLCVAAVTARGLRWLRGLCADICLRCFCAVGSWSIRLEIFEEKILICDD